MNTRLRIKHYQPTAGLPESSLFSLGLRFSLCVFSVWPAPRNRPASKIHVRVVYLGSEETTSRQIEKRNNVFYLVHYDKLPPNFTAYK